MTAQTLSYPTQETSSGLCRPRPATFPAIVLYSMASSVFGSTTMGAPVKDIKPQVPTFAGAYMEGRSTTMIASSTSPQQCVLELRLISGLTWKELASLFRVSQRTMHSWANGENTSAGHDLRIREVLERVRRIHDGDAKATAYRLRSLHGDQPLLCAIADLPLSELTPTAVPAHVTRPSRTDGTRLKANWNPTPPFRDRWDSEPITEEIKPVGEYPAKLPRIPPRKNT